MISTDRLRYLDAGKVMGPSGDLAGTSLRGADGQTLGEVDGVVVDPSERRLLYFVVKTPGWLRNHRRLVPADVNPHVDHETGAMCVDVGSKDLSHMPEFEAKSVPNFGDDDVIDAIFSRRTA